MAGWFQRAKESRCGFSQVGCNRRVWPARLSGAYARDLGEYRQRRFDAPRPGADPYRRKVPTFRTEVDRALDAQVVGLGRVQTDQSEFRLKYEPGHPSADANGHVKYPNVNSLVEMMDLKEAQRSYEANINVITASRRMLQRTIEILKS